MTQRSGSNGLNRRQVAGAMGENLVMNELLWRGWLAANINGAIKQAPNVDLIAAKGSRSVHLQVKASTDMANDLIEVGRGKKDRYFNSKQGPLAHFVIFLKIKSPLDYECYVVPVDIAEQEISRCYQAYLTHPKLDGGRRSEAFPASIYLRLNKNHPETSNYREKWAKYRDGWDQLEHFNAG